MRLWISGPRLGPIRPGISFGLPRYRSAQRNARVSLGEYVYVVENLDSRHNKIGYSYDPVANLRSLQRGSSVPLSLAFSIAAADRAFDVEQEAHAILDRHRLEGEWFDVPKAAAIASIYAAAARLGVPLGDDIPLNGISMERKIIGAAITGAILFVGVSAFSWLPMDLARIVAGATVITLILRRLIRRRPKSYLTN